jgi:hypothetical protein
VVHLYHGNLGWYIRSLVIGVVKCYHGEWGGTFLPWFSKAVHLYHGNLRWYTDSLVFGVVQLYHGKWGGTILPWFIGVVLLYDRE